MAYETIDFKADGPIARITLNRPDRLNSFTLQMHEELRNALGSLGDARVVILTGAGRGFCAGQDLNDRAVAPGEAVDLGETVQQCWNPLIRTLASLPPLGLAAIKEMIRSSWQYSLDEELERQAGAMRRLGLTEDYREGVAAFLEKRTPKFVGR